MRCQSPSGVPRHPRASEPGALRNHRPLPNNQADLRRPPHSVIFFHPIPRITPFRGYAAPLIRSRAGRTRERPLKLSWRLRW